MNKYVNSLILQSAAAGMGAITVIHIITGVITISPASAPFYAIFIVAFLAWTITLTIKYRNLILRGNGVDSN